MAGITHIADFAARLGSTAVPQAGFGVPLIVGYHSHFPELVRAYTGDPAGILSDLEDDGFDTDENLYKLAQRMLGQEFAPRTIKIGRLTTAPYQALRLTPGNLTEDSVYTLEFSGPEGSESVEYVVPSSATATSIAQALVASIAAFSTLTSVSAAYSAGGLTVDAVTGTSFRLLWDVNGRSRPSDLDLLDQSAVANIDTQLSAIEAEDSAWYALLLDVESVAIATAAAAWVASRSKLYFPETSDADATESGTSSDIGSVVSAALNNRACPVWASQYRQGRAAALVGTMLPRQAGSATWALKQLRGDTADDLAGGLFTTLSAKNYTVLRKLNGTLAATDGGSAAGNYEWIDIVQAFDWTEARCEEAATNLLLSNDKVPFTRTGLALVRATFERVVADAIAQGILSPGDPDNAEEDPVPRVVLPNLGEAGAAAADRAARRLSNVKITGRFQGAVHSVLGTLVFNF